MLETLGTLLKSRKAVSALLAIAAATTLAALGKIPMTEYLHFTGALTAVLMASTALEDAAAKRNPGNIHNDGDTQ